VIAETATRETFDGLATWEIVLWYCLIGVSVAIFAFGVGRLVLKYRRGRREPLDRPLLRLARAGHVVFTHAWIRRRDAFSGIAHLFVFYGFLVLFLGTAILAFQDDFAEPVFGYVFWKDWFYRVYSLFLDVFGAVLALGLVAFAAKRWLVRPERLRYDRPAEPAPELAGEERVYRAGDRAFVGSLFFLALSGFLLEAFRIAADDPSFEVWSPIGWGVGQGFIGIGFEGATADAARAVDWWVHGLFALFWVSSIPFTKAVHMIAGPAGVAVRDDLAGRRLAPLPEGAKPEEVGYATIDALSWRHLLDLDACTKCGKCHAACPAAASGYPLSPRDLVLDLREVAEGAMGNRALLGVGPRFPDHTAILGTIKPETLWSCMQCMACVEICPVGIEHVPIINQMRRQLVERGEMDAQLQGTLETIYNSGNSFGEPKRKRARWTRDLDFEIPDARKDPVEYLFFVGDYASFDPRNVTITQALARVLHTAGVEFGILYDAEKTAGNDVRRVGEEGLWRDLAEENAATIAGCEFERILCRDPHSLNTLRNEYPLVGGEWDVLHHSQLLLELFESGRLRVRKGLGYRITYHDPCTLGRYNGIYEEPRRLLELLGCELVEMPRNRDNSFCCGAGGGRIWMKELRDPSVKRPSEDRIDEAVALGGIDYFVVACPKDVTMYEDAIKTSGHAGEIELRELSELVLEALALEPEPAAVAAPDEAESAA
jgi:Fe-S oxidoreductase